MPTALQVRQMLGLVHLPQLAMAAEHDEHAEAPSREYEPKGHSAQWPEPVL